MCLWKKRGEARDPVFEHMAAAPAEIFSFGLYKLLLAITS